MSIKPLSRETIKLINSTQVITSIYSAVKELVENSLDAQAQNIEVNLVDNGLSLVEVKDNGTGICREDAQYMALPSYTSKISDFNDLDLLSTYGFRGEGLTSICQVSDVTICTKTASDETMICYTLDNEGLVIASELSHGLTGTTVQMRNLFKNMPVRRNILNNKKRISQELKAIEILLKTYAVCKPSIRFMLRVNRNTIFTKPSCKIINEALQSVLGTQTYSKLSQITIQLSETEIQLFIPKRDVKDCSEISQTGLQFICVNDRPIRSKEIEKRMIKRISEYFNENNSHSRKFVFCLTLKVNPSMLDVNLEPNKDKVFLRNEAVILAEIDKSILNYYGLQDSQMTTQNDIENIQCNENVNEATKEKEKVKAKDTEKEWPACKKRKLNENIQDTVTINKIVTNEKQNENVKNSDNDFLKSISGPFLSDSDSNDANEVFKNKEDKKDSGSEKIDIPMNINTDSEPFDLPENASIKNQVIEETLSQLPKVDLGEDFDWKEILNKNKNNTSSTSNFETTNKQQITDITWSKGQVPGLQGGVTIGIKDSSSNKIDIENYFQDNQSMDQEESESFDLLPDMEQIDESEEAVSNIPIFEVNKFEWNETLKNVKKTPSKSKNDKLNTSGKSKQSKKVPTNHVDSTQTKIPFAGDNACLTAQGLSAFAMYCATARTKILKQHPELTPPEVAIYMNKQWKEISPEERQYYRDLAIEHNESISKPSTSKVSKKTASQLSQAEKEKTRKQFINVLGNMKINKAEVKNESMVMRTFVPWDINLSLLTKKFKKPATNIEMSIIGSLNSLIWILKLTSKLFVFDIAELHAQLNVQGYDMSQISNEYVTNLVNQWFIEKNDMSVFHPLHSIKN